MKRRAFLGGLAALVVTRVAKAARPAADRETCPVCGMLIAKYPNWTATITYRDGHRHAFDGAKDLFKFWQNPTRYAPGHSREQIAAVAVTEFYGLERIDARQAYYVIGSDVLGPMGHELVPLASRDDAEEFHRDHKGRRILRFDEVNPALLEQLDANSPATARR